jgi:predicted DCC family thiol-disulfide oxidoreductase YuxK
MVSAVGKVEVGGVIFPMQKRAKTLNTQVKFPVLLFDGVCNLCNASVQWVLQHDPKGIFYFAALQSETGQRLLQQHGLDAVNFDSVVLVDGAQIFMRSDAPLEVARRLGGFWWLLYAGKVVPRPIRDAIYNWVARNRYRWFGQREACMLPRPEWKARFI